MISTNALSIYILQHDQNEISDQNICSIQDAMRSDKPASSKFKRVSTDFPNLAVLTKSATPGEIQEMYAHTSVGNNTLGKIVTAFALARSFEATTMILINIERAFAGDGEKICLPKTEVLLHAAADEPTKSKKFRDWKARNSVLLPQFLTEIELTYGENTVEVLLRILTKRINDQEAENAEEESDTEEKIRSNKDNKKNAKTRSTKYAMARNTTYGTAANRNGTLAFLQVVELKAPQVQAALISLRADKHAAGSFRQWADRNLEHQAPPNKAAPQDQSGLTGVLSEVATRLQNIEALRPIVAEQRKADRETCSWYHLLPKSQRIIFASSTADRVTILSAPPPSIHRFLNNVQAHCGLTYSVKNIFFPTALCQALLQDHILAILDPGTPRILPLLLTLTSSSGTANAQQRMM